MHIQLSACNKHVIIHIVQEINDIIEPQEHHTQVRNADCSIVYR